MPTRLSVDKAGRLVLPKPVREELQLQPGDTLELESSEDHIVLRPVRGTMPLHRKKGIWVFHADEPITVSIVDDTLHRVRQERDETNLRGLARKKR